MKIRRQQSTALIDKPQTSIYWSASEGDRPQTILEKIIWQKERENAQSIQMVSFSQLVKQVEEVALAKDFLAAIHAPISTNSHTTEYQTSPVRLIAEVKKASPSKGVIRADFDPVAIAQAYEEGGASCLSVLCDRTFFQGSFSYLCEVAKQVSLPILCKEFMISPYQVWQARAAGADAILLIVAVLCDEDLKSLSELARQLGMRSLVEVHTLEELDRAIALPQLELLGINNRNLEDFSVDLANTQTLIEARRSQLAELGVTVVSESGIYSPQDIAFVGQQGAGAVLVGESLVKQPDIAAATRQLLNQNR